MSSSTGCRRSSSIVSPSPRDENAHLVGGRFQIWCGGTGFHRPRADSQVLPSVISSALSSCDRSLTAPRLALLLHDFVERFVHDFTLCFEFDRKTARIKFDRRGGFPGCKDRKDYDASDKEKLFDLGEGFAETVAR